MAAYNAAPYIRSALKSALDQRGVDLEVVVVDDGSRDATWDLIKTFGDRVRAVRQSRRGYIPARNRAARLATGSWLAFLDADDEWAPDKLAKQCALIDGRSGLIYTDRVNIGDVDRVAPLQSASIKHCEGAAFEDLLLENFITLSSVLMERAWFDRLDGFCEGLGGCEDWDLWLRYAAAGGLLRCCPEPLTLYRWHDGAMSRNYHAMCRGRLEVLQRAIELHSGKAFPRRLARRALAKAWKCSAWQAARSQPRTALRWYLRALWHWPWERAVYKEALKCCLGMA
jgi:glycosyltransferase involved in cell wall biosynthesis